MNSSNYSVSKLGERIRVFSSNTAETSKIKPTYISSSINYSPVRILKAVRAAEANVLVENCEKVVRTLDAFITKAFKGEECPNNILAFKLHLFKYVFEYLMSHKKVCFILFFK